MKKKFTAYPSSIKCNTALSTQYINDAEQEYILSLFGSCDINVVNTYEDTGYEDGVSYKEFVVQTDNTNQLRLSDLMTYLRELDEENDIGNYRESNNNGFYAYDYHFYHYFD